MNIRKYRWSRDYESAEEELISLMAVKQIEATRWAAEADVVFEQQLHQLDKRLWCVEGSIKYMINDALFSLQPGDALDIPAGTPHSAISGFSGCALYEDPDPARNPSTIL